MSSPKPFVHLHTHSEYSLLSATSRFKDLVAKAAEYGMPALALTDSGNLFGAIEFFKACKEKNIKPIIGCELYVAPGSRHERATHGLVGASHPLVVLSENTEGYQNLIKLVSAGYLDGFYYRPRVDKEILREYHAGLIALSGSLASEIPYLLNIEQNDKARKALEGYLEMFGIKNFFIELQDTRLRDQDRVNERLIALAREFGVGLVATSNVYYMTRKDSEALEVTYCINSQNTLQDDNRPRVLTQENYFKTAEEMSESFAEVPEAIENTIRIAERCGLEIDFKTIHLPRFETPGGVDAGEYLRKLTWEGAERRYPSLTQPIRDRIEHELKVIHNLGYDSYFLIVWDFVRFAREKDIPVGPGRGSAAGSVISYSLGITNLDPLRYDLLFERFLNPERVSMPDIDIDFCYERRDEVIQYVTEKYSSERVAQIITFGTMMAKGVLRDVGRVLGIPYAEVDRIAKLVPTELNITLKDALEKEPELKKMVEAESRIRQLFTLSQALEGLPRHASTHAAGVVISAEPLTKNVPLFKTSDGQISTMYPMNSLEKINILKFDFLGLRTLTVIEESLKIIRRIHKRELEILSVPLDDPATFALLGRAQSMGVFQLESSGMRDILRKLKPDKFEDLIAVLALFRPGPIGSGMVDDFIKRKNGKTLFKYDHPLLEPILKDTYGIVVYQEQIMKIANSLAGFTLAQADSLRRAISKKKPEVIELQKKVFVEGCVGQKVDAKLAERIFELIMHFAGYGFNKSHSAAYALISYQTAYLKATYPTEFMTALLSSEKDNTDKVVEYIDECRRMGIEVLPPDVNESFPDFTVVGGKSIRFGLAAVKNVGQAAIEGVIENRKKTGPFKDLFEFCERVDSRAVNRKTIESLVKCGAFDSLGSSRAAVMAVLDQAMTQAGERQKDRHSGQMSLFDVSLSSGFGASPHRVPPLPEWPKSQKLTFEKELMGFYVTGHPLEDYKKDLNTYSTHQTSGLVSLNDGDEIFIGGMVNKLKLTVTKKTGDRMAILTVEDPEGLVEALVFPRVFADFGYLLKPDAILFFKGKIDRKEEEPKLIVQEISTAAAVRSRLTRGVVIELEEEKAKDDALQKVQEILSRHSGPTPVYLRIVHEGGDKSEMIIDRSLFVTPSPDLVHSVEEALGGGTIHLQT